MYLCLWEGFMAWRPGEVLLGDWLGLSSGPIPGIGGTEETEPCVCVCVRVQMYGGVSNPTQPRSPAWPILGGAKTWASPLLFQGPGSLPWSSRNLCQPNPVLRFQ